MSHPVCEHGGMKLNRANWYPVKEHELIATFGDARLVCNLDGRHELIGGTSDDLTAAREWCSMFAHNQRFCRMNFSAQLELNWGELDGVPPGRVASRQMVAIRKDFALAPGRQSPETPPGYPNR
jgi:hypothetical protein